MTETNKARWRRQGDLQYVRLEVRPPRKAGLSDNRCSVTLDYVPEATSRAYDAMVALQVALVSHREKYRSEHFYAALAAFAKEWTP